MPVFQNPHLAQRNGFTIVELLIVIVVIGILAAITIVAYNGITSRAIDTSLQSDLRNGSGKIKLVNAETGLYPASLVAAELVASPGNEYEYTQSGSGSDYCLTVANASSASSYFIDSTTNVAAAGLCPGHTLPTPPVYPVYQSVSTSSSSGYLNSHSLNHTVVAGDDRFVIVFIATRTPSITGVTYGGQPMQQLFSHVNTNQSGVTAYGLEAPPTGVSSVVASFSGFVLSTIAVLSYDDMYQGGGNIGGFYDDMVLLSGYSVTPTLDIETTVQRSLVFSILSTTLDPTLTGNPGTVRANIAHPDANLGRLVISEIQQENPATISTNWAISPIDNFTLVNVALRGS